METLRVLSLVVQSILMTTALNNDKLPFFGPRMCERLCQRTVGCSSFQYSRQNLSCKLQSDPATRLDDSFQNFTIKEDKKADKGTNLSCPASSKIFFSRREILQCRDNTPVLPSELQPTGGRQSNKLLLYEQGTKGMVTEISLSDYTFHTLHYKFDSRIYSMIYVSSLRSFLIMTVGGDVYMYDISKEKKSERIDKPVFDACVAKDNIFYLKPKRLMRMTLSGTDKVSITRFNFFCLYIKVDITKSNLYIFSHDEIKRVSYKGKVLWTSSVKIGTMCLGQNGDFLYITNLLCTIFKLSFSNERSRFATFKVSSWITSLFLLGNQFYAVTGDCHVLSFGSKGSQEIKNIKHPITTRKCFGSLKIED